MLIQLSNIYQFIVLTCRRCNIDETHGIRHAMDVFNYSEKLFKSEVKRTPNIITDERIIYTSALLHDMCDKKYMREMEGVEKIDFFLKQNAYIEEERSILKDIITQMSYSTIKKYGVPDMGTKQLAFQIVRESDLLSAYDFDRCVLYDMLVNDRRYELSVQSAKELFDNRVFKHIDDGLFKTPKGLELAHELHIKSKSTIDERDKTIKNLKIK